jgi:hypothetical protein
MVDQAKHSRPKPHRLSPGCVVLLLISAVLPACAPSAEDVANGDDPMEALAVPHLSERYDVTYWTQTSFVDEELWERAVDFCEGIEDPRDYPNCNVVRSVKMLKPEPRVEEPDSFSLMLTPWDQDTSDSR